MHAIIDAICGRPLVLPEELGHIEMHVVLEVKYWIMDYFSITGNPSIETYFEKVNKIHLETFATVLKLRETEIRFHLSSSDFLSQLGSESLADFDWSIKHIVGSNLVAGTSMTVLVLTLKILSVNGEIQVERIEMSSYDLSKLLRELEMALGSIVY